MSTKLIASADVGGDSAPKGNALEVITHRDALHTMATLNLSPGRKERLLKNRVPFNRMFLALVDLLSAERPKIVLANSIFGDQHFISPADIMARYPGEIEYTDEQIAMLDASLPEEEKLWEMKAKGVLLCASMPSARSMLGVRAFRRELFHSKRGGWYSKPHQTFASNDKTSCRWIALSESTVRSNHASFTYDHLPNVAQIAWFLAAFHDVRNIRAFDGKLIATSSKTAMSNTVALGFTGECINVVDDEGGRLKIDVAPSSSLDPHLPLLLK